MTPTLADRAPTNMQHDYTECRFCSILCRKRTLIENKNVEFLFCNFGNACTRCVGVVWCEGNRVNHRTTMRTTDYRTSTGQVQDNYRRTTGHCPTVKPALRTRLRTLSRPPLSNWQWSRDVLGQSQRSSNDHWAGLVFDREQALWSPAPNASLDFRIQEVAINRFSNRHRSQSHTEG